MAHPPTFLENLNNVKLQIDRGDDFSIQIREAQKIIDNPEFNEVNVKRKSAAAVALFRWVVSIIEYAKQGSSRTKEY